MSLAQTATIAYNVTAKWLFDRGYCGDSRVCSSCQGIEGFCIIKRDSSSDSVGPVHIRSAWQHHDACTAVSRPVQERIVMIWECLLLPPS